MVVGTQRTGTTLLRHILNSNDSIVMVAEVMLPYPDSCHWEHFAACLPPGSLPPPDERAGLDLLDRYFTYLHGQVRAKWNGPRKQAAGVIGVDRQSLQTPTRNENGANHQREDEEDQADHASPPVADACRDEHEAPKQG